MTSPSEPRTTSLYHAAPRGAVAVWLAGAGFVAIVLSQIVLGMVGASVDLMAGGSFVAAIVMVAALARPMPGALGIRRVPVRFIVAGVLVGGASWYLRLRLVELFPFHDDTKVLEQATVEPSLVTALIAVAVLPAIAEELIFRGVIARSLARHSQVLAIAVSSILFALYHLIPIQMVAVFPFGLALAFIAVRADSIVPTMIAHAINNTIGIVIARGDVPCLAALDRHPQLAIAGSSGLVALGLVLAWRIAP
ncbi:MAG TPA: CPBP family intramembrane glutamic endopeptidase [Kofleriaceae bacterium]|jgi:membrane protease YdiL (CAAX protease family)